MAVDKLVDSAQLDADLASVAAAIRTKGGTSAQLAFPAGMVAAIQAIPTGGGGAANIVTGTFKGTTAGAAIDIDLSYTGSGYPVVVVIYPKEGTYKSGGAYFDLIQRYAANFYLAIKNDPSTAPTYSGNQTNENYSSVCQYRKSNATSSTTYVAGASASTKNYTGDSASGGSNNSIVTFKSDTKMSVFIASTSYGFTSNIEYTYHVIYSS